MASILQQGMQNFSNGTFWLSELITNIINVFLGIPMVYRILLIFGVMGAGFWFTHFFREWKRRDELKQFLKKQREIEII